MSQHKADFTHLFVTNLTFIFMWIHLMKNQLKIWRIKNFKPLHVIIPEILRILVAFSYVPAYSEICSPPVFPLAGLRKLVYIFAIKRKEKIFLAITA